jgi:hypothetical protein
MVIDFLGHPSEQEELFKKIILVNDWLFRGQ